MERFEEALRRHIREGIPFELVSITDSSGSVPRGAGARMLVSGAGFSSGTIGGGMIEYQAALMAAEALREKESFVKDFSLSAPEEGGSPEIGMICGGAVTLGFRYIDSREECFGDLCRELLQDTAAHLEDGRAYVFGGGHVALELVPLLARLGFPCVVLDDREEFANRERFPEAVETMSGDFIQLCGRISVKKEDYVCIMSRGHQYDYEIQGEMLKTPAGYIGVMGSRKKTEAVGKKLLADGFTESDLRRFQTPIGLPIRAETPAEIAVSIAGQLVLERAARRAKPEGR